MSMVEFVKKLVQQKVNKPSEIAKRIAEEYNLPLTIAERRLDEIVENDRTLQYIPVVTKGRIGRLYAPGEKIPREWRISYHWEREPENLQKLRMRRSRRY